MKKADMDLIKLNEKYKSQEQCIAYLEQVRWAGKVKCVYCESSRITKLKKSFRHHCNGCNKSFSVFVGTIFEGTKVPLIKWFTAICLITNAKKGISSRQLARDIKVNKDTAWYMQMRVRSAMKDDHDDFLDGIIEADETYVGGAMKNKNLIERNSKYQGVITGMTHKIPLLGIYQRQGKIIVKTINKATGKHIKPVLKKLLSKNAELVTDGFGGYAGLDKVFKKHIILYHSKNEHRKGDYHTNTIEGFWSMLKRSIIGQYHKVSQEHIQSYVDELSFKYNYRNQNIFNTLIIRSVSKTLPFDGT